MQKRHSKMAGKRASEKAKSHRVFGQARKPARMFRAALYSRVSTNDRHTLSMQSRNMREYAARRGWSIAMQVREVGSGAAQREAREKLLDAARRREIDIVVVWRLDRWGRSVTDLLATLQELEHLGVGFVSLTEADARQWTHEGGLNNAAAIPNPLPIPALGGADPGVRVVVAAGRLSQEKGFDLLLDVTCVDYFGQPDGFQNAPETWDRNHNLVRKRAEWRHRVNLPARGDAPRFAVVYHLVSTRLLHRLRVKCRVPEDNPVIASLSALWPGANWLERETFDLYGIRFDGHPDLRRIYLYDEFVGHPLRKDYAKHDEQPIEPYAGPGAQEPRRPN